MDHFPAPSIITDSPCLWMQAGVVRNRFCRVEYRCSGCRFDRAMRRAAGNDEKRNCRRPIVSWQDRLRQRPARLRPCVHHMRGRIAFTTCTHDYRCSRCEFDQVFDDPLNVHTLLQPVAFLDVDGFRLPQGYYLHRGHAWVKIEMEHAVRIGLDDFAFRVFGPPDRIIAPLVGKAVCQGGAAFELIRGHRKATVRSPVGGVVSAFNSELRHSSRVAGHSPYSDGWVLQVQADDLRRDLKALLIGMPAADYIKKETRRLQDLVEDTRSLAADGGFFGQDIFGSLPQLGWERLAGTFL